MNCHITKSQTQEEDKESKKQHNTENSKDEQQKNVGHHYTQTYIKTK
jgi:hypothetical protein